MMLIKSGIKITPQALKLNFSSNNHFNISFNREFHAGGLVSSSATAARIVQRVFSREDSGEKSSDPSTSNIRASRMPAEPKMNLYQLLAQLPNGDGTGSSTDGVVCIHLPTKRKYLITGGKVLLSPGLSQGLIVAYDMGTHIESNSGKNDNQRPGSSITQRKPSLIDPQLASEKLWQIVVRNK